MRSRTAHRVTAALLLALATVVACSDDQPTADPSRSPTTPPPASSSIDPQATVKARVLAAYRGFWAAATFAESHPNRRHPQLAKFATDKALAQEQATIVLYRQQGIVGRGKPKLNPEVVSLALGGSRSTALIRDCVDLTDVDALYRSTGKSAIAPNQSRRHPATAKAVEQDGHWLVSELAADRNRPC